VTSPPRLRGERLVPSRPTPEHGENTDAVLKSFNQDEKAIAALRAAGVIA